MHQNLSAKRENFRQELRKKDKQTRLANKRNQMSEESVIVPTLSFEEALKMFLIGKNPKECLITLSETIDLKNEPESYRKIMQLVDNGMVYQLVLMLK